MAGRRRRGLVALLVSLVLLVVVAAVLDEVARRVVEKQAATQIQHLVGTSEPIAVNIGGWPFVADVVTGRVPTATVTSPRVTFDHLGEKITVSDIRVDAHDVRNLHRPQDAVAGTLDVYATASWAVVSQHGRARITSAGGDRASFTGTVDLLGAQVAVSISAVPRIDPTTHRLVLSEPKATVAGVDLPTAALASAAESLAARISLPAPQGFTYQSVEATGGGLRVHLSGRDVPLSGLP
ncbi:MAG TPA: DUF2993 domain-containing protein [Propionibacteriaceae bacterium]|nr:DUF2993 domain-containing protein [Propionibacteriaceae bacterium]